MSSFEWNKIIGAILVTLLAIKTFDIVGNGIYHPKPLEQNVYVVVGAAQAAATTPGATAAAAKQVEPIAPILASANIDTGKKAAQKCAICHSFDKGGANKIGPNLWGIVNGPHAHAPGFAFSDAIRKMPGNWDYEALNQFIANPKGYAPGTKMAFAGVPRAAERADIIAFLRSLADNPAPLP